MTTAQARPLVQPGEPAPDFTLPAVHRDGTVSLADYRGESPLLLAVLRGLYCAFCRRHVVQLGTTRGKLQAVGVETLAIVATNPERARLYLRYRPTTLPLASDPQFTTHQAYGVPRLAESPEFARAVESVRVSLPELPRPLPYAEAGAVLHGLNPYEWSKTDEQDSERRFPTPIAQFMVDRDGIIRWVNVEVTEGNLAGMGAFPADEEFLAAARKL